MKLPLYQLDTHLNKKVAPIYVISGDEPLLVEEAIDSIRKAALRAGFSERNKIPAEGNDWGVAFYANTQALSLFASKRILELDLTTAKFTAATSKIIQEYAQQYSQDIILVIRMNKLDSKSEQSAWYKAVDSIGLMIPVWPVPLDQLPGWIMQRAKKMNLNLTPGAAKLLAGQVEGNLLAASQELEKLSLLQITTSIDEETIQQTAADNTHFDIFALVDSALLGDAKRSLQIIRNLCAEDTEPTLVLWALARELRTLSELAEVKQQGGNLAAHFSKFRIFEKRQPNVRAFLQRHSQRSCWSLLDQAAEIDRIIKGAKKGQSWVALERLILAMVGTLDPYGGGIRTGSDTTPFA